MLRTINQDLFNGSTTCESLVKTCLALARKHVVDGYGTGKNDTTHNTGLNIFTSLADETSLLKRAQQADERRKSGKSLGIMDGIPIAVKDNICTEKLTTTCGSKMLQNFTSPFNATAVQRLESAGAIVIGKTNMDEFGMGSFNVNSYFGATKNPSLLSQPDLLNKNDFECSGGSSGGSAASVSANIGVVCALGSDTGGSVRLPASFCKTVGFKPSYGRISRYGLVAYASSLDTIGVLSSTVFDAAAMYNIIAGQDSLDSTSIPEKDIKIELNKLNDQQSLNGVRIGIPKEYRIAEMSQEALESWSATIEECERKGATVVPMSLPSTPISLAVYYVLACAEASSNLSKYTGVQYGLKPSSTSDLDFDQLITDVRSNGFGEEVKRRILLGTFCLSRSVYSSFYLKAQQLRQIIREEFNTAFGAIDIILTPTAPSPPPLFSQVKQQTVVESFAMDVFTVPASLAGLPAINLPVKSSSSEPHKEYKVGVQLIGPYLGEEKLLRVSSALHE